MKSAIDRSGRVVIPKAIRDRLRLRGGETLEIVERDGVIELWPAPLEVELVKTPEGIIAVPSQEVPPLTGDIVRDALEKTRR